MHPIIWPSYICLVCTEFTTHGPTNPRSKDKAYFNGGSHFSNTSLPLVITAVKSPAG